MGVDLGQGFCAAVGVFVQERLYVQSRVGGTPRGRQKRGQAEN
jgi:hypothetical protein